MFKAAALYKAYQEHPTYLTWQDAHPEATRDVARHESTTEGSLLDGLLVKGVGAFLDMRDKAALSRSARRLHSLFKPALQLTRLLEYVVHGEQENAQDIILPDSSELLVMRGDVTDYSGHTFHNVTN